MGIKHIITFIILLASFSNAAQIFSYPTISGTAIDGATNRLVISQGDIVKNITVNRLIEEFDIITVSNNQEFTNVNITGTATANELNVADSSVSSILNVDTIKNYTADVTMHIYNKDDDASSDKPKGILIQTINNGNGAGDIDIKADGSGGSSLKAGNINIIASQFNSLDGGDILIQTEDATQGGPTNDGGNITLSPGNGYSSIGAVTNGETLLTRRTRASGVMNIDGDFIVSSNKMYISSANGKVGIGNTNPEDFSDFGNDLVIGSAGTMQGITIYNATNGVGTLLFADGDEDDIPDPRTRGFVQYNHTGDTLILGAGGSSAFYLDFDGTRTNVGIGTSSPSTKFEVNGDSTFGGDVGIGTNSPSVNLHLYTDTGVVVQRIESDDSDNGIMQLQLYNDSDKEISLGKLGSNVSVGMFRSGSGAILNRDGDLNIINDGNDDIIFYTDETDSQALAATEKMRITASGNLMVTGNIDSTCNTLKMHRIVTLNTPVTDTWTTCDTNIIIDDETSGDTITANATAGILTVTKTGIYSFGGCVHFQNGSGGDKTPLVASRILINGTDEARCSQRDWNGSVKDGGQGALSYNGTVFLNAGDSIALQYYIDDNTISFISSPVFQNKVAWTLWLTYCGHK